MMWREFVLDALHVGRPNLESYTWIIHSFARTQCAMGRYFHELCFRLASVMAR
jgi:hypothetical protein